jgi:hypothetical protein
MHLSGTLTTDPEIPFLRIFTQEKQKHLFTQKPAQIFVVHLLLAHIENNPIFSQ